ncbi:MAG: glycine zipper 2TM domain-containing protein [Desulfovibrionaceae bacterium]|nr:glycine zipper 2TM domain-containing protein [Desulfovibrionaceae bacterium]
MALFLAALLAGTPFLGGCAPKVGGNDYTASGAQSSYSVEYGTVESVRTVSINNDSDAKTAIGAVGGGVVGGILGSMIGGGRGRTLATAVGVGAGALAGGAASGAVGNQAGVEVTVRLDSGGVIVVVQGDDISFTPGQRVHIITGHGSTRVAPL